LEEFQLGLQAERHLMIMKILRDRKVISVNELSSILTVSANTIRRDLSLLEEQGVLKRSQGGAVLNEVTNLLHPFEIRKNENAFAKDIIGQTAAKLVTNNDTIILDSGTTTLQLAKSLNIMWNLTILTNSIDMADEFLNNPNIVVILSGGIIRQTSRSLIGLPAEQFFLQYHVSKTFLGVGGVSVNAGITNHNMYETSVKRRMIEAADEVIILADHTKIGKVLLSQVAPLDMVNKIITDQETPLELIKEIKAANIEVIIAE
jgi:DeoR family fructose operon transcriptional repressor